MLTRRCLRSECEFCHIVYRNQSGCTYKRAPNERSELVNHSARCRYSLPIITFPQFDDGGKMIKIDYSKVESLNRD